MLCVALVIILIAWSALCIATMTHCIVYEYRDTENDGLTCDDIVSRQQLEHDNVGETNNIVSVELALRWCGIIISIVLIISISAKYDC